VPLITTSYGEGAFSYAKCGTQNPTRAAERRQMTSLGLQPAAGSDLWPWPDSRTEGGAGHTATR